MELKDKLIMLRKREHLSQLELSERTDVSRQTISKWEVGLALPTRENLKQLAKIYNVSIDWLCSDSEESYVRPETIVFPPSPPEKERAEQKKTNWKTIIMAGIIVLLAAALALSLFERKNNDIPDQTPIDDLYEDDIGNADEGGISFEW